MFGGTAPTTDPQQRRKHLHALVDACCDPLDAAEVGGPGRGPALAEVIRGVEQLRRAVNGIELAAIPAYEASHDWRAANYHSPATAIAGLTGRARKDAHGLVKDAKAIADVPAVAAAVDVLPVGHLAALARARKPVVADAYDAEIESLVTDVIDHPVSLDRLRLRLRAWHYETLERLARNEPDGRPPEDPSVTPRTTCRQVGDVGVIHTETSATVLAMWLEHAEAYIEHAYRAGDLPANTPAAERRSRSELYAEAFEHLLRHGPMGGTRHGHPRPLVLAIADLDTILQRAGVPEADRMTRVAEIQHGGPVADTVINQLLCDADLSLVITWQGEPLYVGRTSRTATPAQIRAIKVRTGGKCEHPRCHVTHDGCHAHHIQPWHPPPHKPDQAGGNTDLPNLRWYCAYHHGGEHRGDFTVQDGPDGPEYYDRNGNRITPHHDP